MCIRRAWKDFFATSGETFNLMSLLSDAGRRGCHIEVLVPQAVCLVGNAPPSMKTSHPLSQRIRPGRLKPLRPPESCSRQARRAHTATPGYPKAVPPSPQHDRGLSFSARSGEDLYLCRILGFRVWGGGTRPQLESWGWALLAQGCRVRSFGGQSRGIGCWNQVGAGMMPAFNLIRQRPSTLNPKPCHH